MKAKSLYLVFYLIISSCSTREEKNTKDQTYYRVEALKDLIKTIEVFKDLKSKPVQSVITYFSSDSTNFNPDSVDFELTRLAQNPYRYNLVVQNYLFMFSLYDSLEVIRRLESIKKFRDHGMIDYLLSIKYQEIDRMNESLTCIEQAIKLNPYIEGYFEQKASLLFRQKKYDQLLKVYDEIISFTNVKWIYHYQKYLVHMITGNAKKAKIEISTAIGGLIEFKKSPRYQELDEQTRDLGMYFTERAKINFEEGKIVDGCDDLRNAKMNDFEPDVELSNKCG